MRTLRNAIVGMLMVEAMGLTLVSARAQTVESARIEAFRDSAFIFQGTVTKVGEPAFREVPASPRDMVVSVETVFEKPLGAMLRSGDEVTLLARTDGELKAGDRYLFFGRSWIFGKGIAVAEVRHEAVASSPDAGGAAESSLASFNALRTEVDEANLRAQVTAADLIVYGEVTDVKPAPLPAHPITSEHNADWQDAFVRIITAVKGEGGRELVVVRFPASRDEAWWNVPKLRPDQKAIFLLTKDHVSNAPSSGVAGATVTTYTALSPLDILPEELLKAVQSAASQH